MRDTAYLLQQAERCRSLAEHSEPEMNVALRELAVQYERQARWVEPERASRR